MRSSLRPQGEPWWLLQHVIIAAGLTLPTARAASVTAGLVAASFATSIALLRRFDGVLLIQAAFGAAAMVVRRLTITIAQLGRAREDLAQLAVADERQRFSRDLHDLLGHTLSLIVLKSELVRRTLRESPDAALREVVDIEHTAREALRQVREAVAGYRQPTLESELAGARELLTAAGIQLELTTTASALPADIAGLLAWSVREGVTNVIRHSRARCCRIALARDGERLCLTVRDDGRGGAAAARDVRGVGHGLQGLHERATALGAEVKAATQPDGFLLEVRVPLQVSVAGEGA